MIRRRRRSASTGRIGGTIFEVLEGRCLLSGLFQTAINYPLSVTSGLQAQSTVAGDFNGDGKIDLLVGTPITSNNAIGEYLLPGRGEGTFGSALPALAVTFSTIVTGDFNHDGILDIAGKDANQPIGTHFALAVALGKGDGTFGPAVNYPGDANNDPVVVADFNLDCNLDLAEANVYTGDVVVFLGDGRGGFAKKADLPSASIFGLVVGDFNGDGVPDLVAGGSPVSLFLGKGDGTFLAPIGINAANGDPRTLIAGDFDGDGRLDLAQRKNDDILVSYGNGDGIFAVPYDYGAIPYAYQIAGGDFNGDGMDDIAVRTGIGLLNTLRSNGRNQPPTRSGSTVDQETGPRPIVTDLNGDGKPDLVVASPGLGDEGVLLNRGDGTFPTRTFVPSGDAGIDRLVGVLANDDFNGDGIPDLVAYGAGLRVLLAKGDGTYPTIVRTPLGVSVNSATTGDLDRDGRRDLLLTLDAQTVILFGAGDGTFPRAVAINPPAGFKPGGAITGDFNGDGRPDLVVIYVENGSPSHHEAVLYQGQGQGTFGPATILDNYDASTVQNVAVAADLNGDGNLDLIVGSVVVLMGRGDGTFQAPVTYAVDATYFTLGDFNGDGRPDIAAIHRISGDSVDVLLNRGDGTFGSPIRSLAGYGIDDFLTADLNGDGRLDLMAPTVQGDAALLGNGDGSFRAPTYYAIGQERQGLIVDVNRDGKPDIVLLSAPDIVAIVNVAPMPLHAQDRAVTEVAGDATVDLVVATFSDSGTTQAAATYAATIAWGDGATTAGVVATRPGGGFVVTGRHAYAVAGPFHVITAITAADGATTSAIATAGVTTPRLAPVVDPIGDRIIDEGTRLAFRVTGHAADSTRHLTFSLDPGAPSGATIDATTGDFSYTPAYNPGTASVTVRISDDGSPVLSDAKTFQITVRDVAPIVSTGGVVSLRPGQTLSRAGSFTDPGDESWTATVDYGDGSGTQPLPLSVKAFELSHTYTTAGTDTVTVSVRSSNGGLGSSSFTVQIIPMPRVGKQGDFNGDGLTDVGIYQPNTGLFALATLTPGKYAIGPQFFPRLTVQPGRNGVPITGDFNGDGLTDIGLYFPALDLFELGLLNAQGQVAREVDLKYGYHVGTNAIPVTGDWSGSGITGIGVYLPDKDLFALGVLDPQVKVAQQIVDPYGYHTHGVYSIPVTGDWSGNGTTGVGIYLPADDIFALAVLSSGKYAIAQQIVVPYGYHDHGLYSVPVTGDWAGNGTTGVGVYLPTEDKFALAALSPGQYKIAQQIVEPYGYHTHGVYSVPVTGDWSGNGTTGVGIYVPADDVFALAVLSSDKYPIAQQIVDPYGYHTNSVFATPIPPTPGQPSGTSSGAAAAVPGRSMVSGPSVAVPASLSSSGVRVEVQATAPAASSSTVAATHATVTIRRRVVPQARGSRLALPVLRWNGIFGIADDRS